MKKNAYTGRRVSKEPVASRRKHKVSRGVPVAIVGVMCCCLVVGGCAMTLGSTAPEDDSLLASVITRSETDNESAYLDGDKTAEKEISEVEEEPAAVEEETGPVYVEVAAEEENPVPVEEEFSLAEESAEEIADAEPAEETAEAEPVEEVAVAEPVEEVAEPVEEFATAEPVEEYVSSEPVKEYATAEPVEEEPAEDEEDEGMVLGVAVFSATVDYTQDAEQAAEPVEDELAEQEEAVYEEPEAEEPVYEEPTVEETVDEEPAVEETVDEEPAVEETVDEEPAQQEEEDVADDPVTAEPEETVVEEPAVEDTTETPAATPSTNPADNVSSSSGIDFPATGVVNATAGLNLRSGSSTSSSIITCIPYNTYLTLTGEENGWYITSYLGHTGYVSADYITITNSDGGGSVSNSGELNFIWPVTGGYISSEFGTRSSGMHYGIDIAIAQGTPIHASESGTVTFSGNKGNTYGNYVIIDHGNGYETLYAHCSSLLVSTGDKVTQGDTIALVGQTGNATGPHCHFEIRINGVQYNPRNWLGSYS